MEIESITIKSEQLDEEYCNIIEEKINIKEEDLQSTNETPYKCGICGHRTTTDTLLKVHMKMHLIKRVHQCNICKKTFSFVTELNSHILTHPEEKNSYQCEVCGRDCFTEEDLHKHYRVHTKEKPFKCKLCFRFFSDDSYLRIHERTHHGEDYFRNIMKKNGTFVDPDLVKNVNEENNTPKVSVSVQRPVVPKRRFKNNPNLPLNNEEKLMLLQFVEELGLNKKYLRLEQIKNYLKNGWTKMVGMFAERDYDRNTEKLARTYFHLKNQAKTHIERFYKYNKLPEPHEIDYMFVKLCTSDFDIPGIDLQQVLEDSKKFCTDASHEVKRDCVLLSSEDENDDTLSISRITEVSEEGSDKPETSGPSNKRNFEGEDGPPYFKCEICQKYFSNEEFLKLHIENHMNQEMGHDIFGLNDPLAPTILPTDISDKYLENCRTTVPVEKPDSSSLECEYTDKNGKKCSRRFGEKEAYDIHFQTHGNTNKKQRVFCRLCKVKFVDDSELSAHMLSIHGSSDPDKLDLDDNMIRCKEIVKGKEKTVFRCTICAKHFPVPSKLRSHLRTHTGEKPFKCDICNKSFGTAGSLKDHSYLHTDKKPFNCTICEKGFTKNSALEDHIRSHTGERPYECNICKKRYTTIVILNQHLLAHAKEKPFKCDVCNKSFIYLCNLKYHMVTHTGSKPFACNLCDKSYSIKNALKIHMMDHRGEKPYKCRFCDKQFTAGNSLKKHERVHTGEKPYICPVCKKGFSQSSSLSRHLDSHKGEKPYRCTDCKKGFTSASYLKIHLKIHQGESPYHCKECNEKFMVIQKYRSHLKQHKKEKKDGSVKSQRGKTEENEEFAVKSEIDEDIKIKTELDEIRTN